MRILKATDRQVFVVVLENFVLLFFSERGMSFLLSSDTFSLG